jgi:Transglutaminase-like superfamily
MVVKARLAVEVLAAYARVRWTLRRTDIRGTLASLRRGRPAGPRVDQPTSAGRRLGRAVVRTLRPLPTDSRCLMRSLVLIHLLARRGVDARLVLAVAPGVSRDRFAHAWVEHDGLPLLDPGGPEYGRLAEL